MSEHIQLREQIASASKALAEIYEVAGAELDMKRVIDANLVPGAKTTTDIVEHIRKEQARLKDLDEKYAPFRALEAGRADAKKLNDEFNRAAPGVILPTGSPKQDDRAAEAKTLGQLFVESTEYKAYLEQRKAGHKGQPFGVSLDIGVKTLFQTSAGWATESLRTGRVELFPLRPIIVTDFIPKVPTSFAAIKYMEETTHTQAAAERAEAAAYAEAAFAMTERSQTVESVGVSLPVTDEQLEDVEGVAAFLDGRLRYQIDNRLDLQVLAGNGTTPNLKGTENVSGIQSQALGSLTTEQAIYKAIRAVRDDGFAEPGVIFIRAAKWEPIRLRQTADGIYLMGSPASPDPEMLWGKRVVQTNAVTSTKAIVGDYAGYSELRVRRGVSVEVGYVNDDFTKGKKTIRAGLRCAMVHYRPKAFGQVTGL